MEKHAITSAIWRVTGACPSGSNRCAALPKGCCTRDPGMNGVVVDDVAGQRGPEHGDPLWGGRRPAFRLWTSGR